MTGEKNTQGDYYSFKIFPRFWLVKSTRIIHHNQLLLTNFEKKICRIEPMTSKVQRAADYWKLNEKTWDEIVLFLVLLSASSSIILRHDLIYYIQSRRRGLELVPGDRELDCLHTPRNLRKNQTVAEEIRT